MTLLSFTCTLVTYNALDGGEGEKAKPSVPCPCGGDGGVDTVYTGSANFGDESLEGYISSLLALKSAKTKYLSNAMHINFDCVAGRHHVTPNDATCRK